MEIQKETWTAQEKFTFEVGEALNHALEELQYTLETVNIDFAAEIKLAAKKYGLSKEQIERELADVGGGDADISIGPGLLGSMAVVELLHPAYCDVLGKDTACRIYKGIENAEKEA